MESQDKVKEINESEEYTELFKKNLDRCIKGYNEVFILKDEYGTVFKILNNTEGMSVMDASSILTFCIEAIQCCNVTPWWDIDREKETVGDEKSILNKAVASTIKFIPQDNRKVALKIFSNLKGTRIIRATTILKICLISLQQSII